jgi:hypothetical protein
MDALRIMRLIIGFSGGFQEMGGGAMGKWGGEEE